MVSRVVCGLTFIFVNDYFLRNSCWMLKVKSWLCTTSYVSNHVLAKKTTRWHVITDGNIYYFVSNVSKYFFNPNIDLLATFLCLFLSSIYSFIIVNINFSLFWHSALCGFYLRPIGWPHLSPCYRGTQWRSYAIRAAYERSIRSRWPDDLYPIKII